MPDKQEQLNRIAASQYGYFTSKQAIDCGYAQNEHHYPCAKGEWLRVGKGLFRLPEYRDCKESEWVRWLLWSRNNQEEVQAALSRQTALDYFGLVQDASGEIHLTVTPEFRKHCDDLRIRLHSERLEEADIVRHGLFRVVNPMRAVQEMRGYLKTHGIYDEVLQKALALDGSPRAQGTQPASPQSMVPAEASDGASVGARADGQAGWNAAQTSTSMPGQSGTDKPGSRKETEMKKLTWRTVARDLRRSPMGFTLVELLVVIAIIGILAALLMPTLKKSVNFAQSSSCINRLRQVGLAVHMYANDYRGWVMLGWLNTFGYTPWHHYISGSTGGDNYAKDRSILRCPSELYVDSAWSAYGCERNWLGLPTQSGVCEAQVAIKIDQVSNKRVLWSDTTALLASGPFAGQYAQRYFFFSNKILESSTIHMRHMGLANGLYADTHVKSCGFPALTDSGIRYVYDEGRDLIPLP